MDTQERTQTLSRLFWEQASSRGEHTFLKVKTNGVYRSISWQATAQTVRLCAQGLLCLGLRPGARVAILSENRPEWIYADLAILSAGGITVPVYPTDTTKSIDYILSHSGADFIFVSTRQQLYKIIPLFSEHIERLQRIICFESTGPVEGIPVMSLDEVLQLGNHAVTAIIEALNLRIKQTDPAATASIIYTSGTTGTPKGVELTHANFLANCDAAAQVISLNHQDIYLSFLPLSHVFERTCGYYLLIKQGACIAYAEHLETVKDDLVTIQPTLICGVPRFFEKIYSRIFERLMHATRLRRCLFFWALKAGTSYYKCRQRADAPVRRFFLWLQHRLTYRCIGYRVKHLFGTRLRFCISGGAPLAPEINMFFEAFGLSILEGYGMTETSPIIAVNRPDHKKIGTVGHRLKGVEVRIAADGEIMVRGKSVMKGYYKMPAETHAVLSNEGWLATGDIGMIDADGFITITDRKKELIITAGGKNISPQKIENILKTDRFIAQIFIYGDQRKYLIALIVPDYDQLKNYARYKEISYLSLKDLTTHPKIYSLFERRIARRSTELARYEKIKYFRLLEHEFSVDRQEVTPTLKLRRKIIQQHYQHFFDSMYREPSGRT